jgi:hypothetical protein
MDDRGEPRASSWRVVHFTDIAEGKADTALGGNIKGPPERRVAPPERSRLFVSSAANRRRSRCRSQSQAVR